MKVRTGSLHSSQMRHDEGMAGLEKVHRSARPRSGRKVSAEIGRARAAGYKDLTDIRGNPVPSVP